MGHAETDIAAVMAAVNEGLRCRDADAVVANYTKDAVIFDLAPPLSHGIDAVGLTAWLDTWDGPVEQASQDIAIIVGGDIAFAHGLIRVSARTNSGHDAAWWMRGTFCLTRREDGWKIVHEHTSVPFHMDGSFRAAVDLQP